MMMPANGQWLSSRSAWADSPGEFRRACYEDYLELISRPGGRGVVERDAVACRAAAAWVEEHMGRALARLAEIRAEEAETVLGLDPEVLNERLQKKQWRKAMASRGREEAKIG